MVRLIGWSTLSTRLLRAAGITRTFLEACTRTDAATAPHRVLRKAAGARTGPRSLLTRSKTRDQRRRTGFVRSWFTMARSVSPRQVCTDENRLIGQRDLRIGQRNASKRWKLEATSNRGVDLLPA